MATQKTFQLLNGVTVDQIGEHLVYWFQNTKKMIAEGSKAQNGYFVQAKDDAGTIKKLSGMSKAVQVQMIKANDTVIVNCDYGKWSDKLGAGVVGAIVFAPLVATAAYGAVKQSQLPNEVFAEIDKFIMYGGSSTVEINMNVVGSADEVICPVCQARNPKGQKFCSQCGAKLGKTCPNCGATVDDDVTFCPECGSPITIAKVCINCGAPLAEDEMFCHVCGAKQEIKCRVCGAVLTPGTKFCPSCGASQSTTKICPNCKAEVGEDEKFCKQCGAKLD